MLLALEGGGFFSSSASGYSSSLSLLLLGQKSEDKSMRVLPLLVDRDPDVNIQLASTKTWISWRCASPSFRRCFRHNPAGPTTPPPLKKPATTQRQDSLRTSPISDNGKNHVPSSDEDNLARKMVLKSSLKKTSDANIDSVRNADGNEATGGKGSCDSSHVERRKVQWTDTCGSQLAEVKEFEPSEINASDDENDMGKRRCLCSIM
ncbi:uncharacterized protein LOC101221691 [Cucumis sativus]|nr:uncharacterized protein LOC101221691 [Cucumis sativus]XP_011656625.1 uncharacterized protein LOC101221691 [Cucumis sativus]XP_011656626.1 uncharacterized protein LOC101221691 [Cucumis sativus]XP_011656627.1 uncharacterized protein LOC101221691 [Cucumis sativus]XP_031743622.1 uncharacterized protein LOC101221691 [Cucumis sativus]XP_031743623.1 uncharacterized protein LOC101221691 [Cucumis sativus]XP_031743624.1 uncharacterized protein LOC101221691 [Cucumis sativus]XP_031743625.1 uncharacte